MLKYKKLIIALSIIPQIIGLKILVNFPNIVETVYSHGIYIGISKGMRYVFGWAPFSVGDILYTLLGLYVIRWFYLNRKRIIKDTKHWVLDVLSAISIGYFAFHLLWAFNYYRLPLHESLHIDSDYTTEELVNLTHQLIDKVNTLHLSLAANDSTKVVMPYSKSEILKMIPNGYNELAKKFPHLEYQPRSIKRSIYSLPLTYMGFSGYLNPFTNESQINGLAPSFKFPTTGSHEVAHQLGYAAENEANFIGSMAAMHHPNRYFNYSGFTFALRHCLYETYKRDTGIYEKLLENINTGVLKNYQEVRDFWDGYKNPTEPLFKATYNNFLKSNNQAGGIESYSYVVALLVNYHKNNPIE
ncbi:amino acid permease [Flavobacteriales bacterium 33_180_T64]|nr:amino acid permease [Flavobacteriales bacterium 33_180_T64]